MSIVIGLTGQTGSGKTTVCEVFERKGFAVINADLTARKVVEKGKPCLTEIAKTFGSDILQSDGTLDRRKLGGIVFNDKSKLELLNNIIYPYITEDIKADIKRFEQQGKRLILLDAPTLFESGADKLCGVIVSVTADDDIRLGRIMSRDGITEEQAKARMASQHTEEFFRNNSDFVIDNSGEVEKLYKQAEIIADKIINGGIEQ